MTNKKQFFLAIFAITLFFGSCATSVNVRTSRLPTWNTLGIQRISVTPFSVSDNSTLQSQAATWLRTTSQSRIAETNHFTVVDHTAFPLAQAANFVDGLFTGQILSLAVRNNTRTETRTNPRTKEDTVFAIYEREVEMRFNYRLINARDGTIIGEETKSDRANSYFEIEITEEEDRFSRDRRAAASMKTAETMVQEIITRNLRNLSRDLVPYIVMEKRNFMKESTKDKVLKARFKEATSTAKSGNHRIAQNLFMDIYRDTGSFPAAYNASLLMMAQGNLEEASAFMQRVYQETGNTRAATEVASIQRNIQNRDMAAVFRENRSRQDVLIDLMINTIHSQLTQNSNAAIVNNSRNERDVAETITNSIIVGLQARNVTIVDRSNRALLEAERNYQLSGYVDDEQIVSIGKETGVNVFVMVSITGTGAMRYLSVRMLDVERSTIIYQSPQTEEMRL